MIDAVATEEANAQVDAGFGWRPLSWLSLQVICYLRATDAPGRRPARLAFLPALHSPRRWRTSCAIPTGSVTRSQPRFAMRSPRYEWRPRSGSFANSKESRLPGVAPVPLLRSPDAGSPRAEGCPWRSPALLILVLRRRRQHPPKHLGASRIRRVSASYTGPTPSPPKHSPYSS